MKDKDTKVRAFTDDDIEVEETEVLESVVVDLPKKPDRIKGLSSDNTKPVGKISIAESFKQFFGIKKETKRRLKSTGTLAHLICNYSYNGQDDLSISKLTGVSEEDVREMIREAKDLDVFEKLALQYQDFNVGGGDE